MVITPLTTKKFQITDAQEHRSLVEFDATRAENGHTQPLQRKQFEPLADRITEAADRDGFDLRRPVTADTVESDRSGSIRGAPAGLEVASAAFSSCITCNP